MDIINKLSQMVFPEETEERKEENKEQEAESPDTYENTSSSELSSEASILLFQPRDFSKEAQEIGEYVRLNKACVVNLRKLSPESCSDMIIWLSGVTFGVGGITQKISDDTILCSPKNFKVDGIINLSSHSND